MTFFLGELSEKWSAVSVAQILSEISHIFTAKSKSRLGSTEAAKQQVSAGGLPSVIGRTALQVPVLVS